jgi:hypothetical protein
MAKAGASLVTGNRNAKLGGEVVRATEQAGGRAAFQVTDVSKPEDAKAPMETLLTTATLSGRADEVRAKVEQLAADGVTELVYQPAGDIQRELETFAAAVELQPTGREVEAG